MAGLNFRLEMPLADAESFLEEKARRPQFDVDAAASPGQESHLRNGLALKSKQVAKVKACGDAVCPFLFQGRWDRSKRSFH